jgi:hypothetical protein
VDIFVDLGAKYSVDSLAIYWEHAGAKKYSVQAWSLDADTPSYNDQGWTTLLTDTTLYYQPPPADWCTSFLKVPVTTTRYVRIRCYQRLTNYGCSIFELEVYGTPVPMGSVPVTGQDTRCRGVTIAYGGFGVKITIDGSKNFSGEIYSAQGQLVRRLTPRDAGAWNYHDEFGNAVKNGMYFVRTLTQGASGMARVRVCR